MTGEQWARVEALFDAGRLVPADARAAWLREQMVESGVRTIVADMLTAFDAEPGFLEPADGASAAVARAVADAEDEREFGHAIGTEIGGWTVRGVIGQGGMGAVYLVDRMDRPGLGALKRLKRGMDTDAVLRRFLQERRILAALDHPHIARLVDGGATADGVPYFVMEYVEGRPITAYCRQARLGARERLSLFLQVIDAVAYSHRHLVVHRDLKPSNILVTSSGSVTLLDFGVAKLLQPDPGDNTTTLQHQRMFTPDYASPEQLGGAPITTATDVYSLGVVLFELVTGSRPFVLDGQAYDAFLRAVRTVEPIRPSRRLQVDDGSARDLAVRAADLRGDIDNIVLRALRKEADRRYASAQEMGDDLRRFLDGRPVRATADSWTYRASKFVQRNTLGTAAAGVATLLAVAAVSQGVAAARARARAEERFAQVRRLANSVLFRYQDSIWTLPGSRAVREQMISDGASYLDLLASEETSDPVLQLELARAYDRLGDVKASFSSASVGDAATARAFYGKAVVIKERLAGHRPTEVAEEIATSHDRLGDLEFGLGRQPEALDHYDRARTIREHALSARPDDRDIRYRLMRTYLRIAVRGRSAATVDTSLALCQKGVAMTEALLREAPGEADLVEAYGDGLEGLAAILETSPTRRPEAVAAYERLIATRREHADRFPANAVLRQKYGMAYSYLGDTYFELGERRKAVDEYRRAVATLDPLIRQDPLNEPLVQDLANVRSSLGYTLASFGDIDESRAIFEQVIPLFQAKFTRDPSDATAHFRLAMATEGFAITFANIAHTPGHPPAERLAALRRAHDLYRESLAIYQVYARRDRGAFPSSNVDVSQAVEEVGAAIRATTDELERLTARQGR